MHAGRQGGAETLGQPRGHGIALRDDVRVGRTGLEGLEQPLQEGNVVGPFLLGGVEGGEDAFDGGEVSARCLVLGGAFWAGLARAADE